MMAWSWLYGPPTEPIGMFGHDGMFYRPVRIDVDSLIDIAAFMEREASFNLPPGAVTFERIYKLGSDFHVVAEEDLHSTSTPARRHLQLQLNGSYLVEGTTGGVPRTDTWTLDFARGSRPHLQSFSVPSSSQDSAYIDLSQKLIAEIYSNSTLIFPWYRLVILLPALGLLAVICASTWLLASTEQPAAAIALLALLNIAALIAAIGLTNRARRWTFGIRALRGHRIAGMSRAEEREEERKTRTALKTAIITAFIAFPAGLITAIITGGSGD